MNSIRRSFQADYLVAKDFMNSVLAGQAGLGLSITRHQLDASALPLRFNFWSQGKYLANFAEEAENIKVLHYLNGPFAKHGDNESLFEVERWVTGRSNSSDPVEQLLVRGLGRVLHKIKERSGAPGHAVNG